MRKCLTLPAPLPKPGNTPGAGGGGIPPPTKKKKPDDPLDPEN
ncbi:MAG TPA: hypothetical protein V6C97_08845 [Oculatellaceae cyanobacterium]